MRRRLHGWFQRSHILEDHVAKEKWPPGSNIPPSRPVESASGTLFENASHFVDHFSNDLVKDLPSYWQDTPVILRCFEFVLYTNIPIQQGIDAFRLCLHR